MNWKTEFHAIIDKIGDPTFDFSCDCKAADAGGLCIHFWTAILLLLDSGKISPSIIGPFADIAGRAIEHSVKKGTSSAVPAPAPEDISGKTIEELLEARTQGKRYRTALEELGLVPPPQPKKKKIKAKEETPEKEKSKADEPHRVEMHFIEKEIGPPARFLTGLYKLEEGQKRESSIHVLIDEKQKVIAHEGCADFAFRLAKEKQLCKHVIQVFVSIDETSARRLLAQLDTFKFFSEMPETKAREKKVARDVLDTKPAVMMVDQESLKSAIMDYLLAHEGDDVQLAIGSIQEALGESARDILPVLKAEGMVIEYMPGHYKAK